MIKQPATRAQLLERLAELGIETTTHDHPAVFSVAESGELHRTLPGGHTKNLFLKDAKGQLFLIVAQSSSLIDLKALPKRIGSARLSFGKPDLLMETLGVAPGSVSAFCLINDTERRVSVIVDLSLQCHGLVNCHPLVNTATTSIAWDDLVGFIAACGHEAAFHDLGAA